MSLALCTEEVWEYWLRADRLKDKDGKDRPGDRHRAHFLMRHLSGREQRILAESLDNLEANHPNDGTSAEYVDLCFAAVKAAGVAGVVADNAGTAVRIAPAELDDIPGLGYRQARELAYAAFAGGVLAGDLGNFDSQSSTDSASSASTAAERPAGDAKPA